MISGRSASLADHIRRVRDLPHNSRRRRRHGLQPATSLFGLPALRAVAPRGVGGEQLAVLAAVECRHHDELRQFALGKQDVAHSGFRGSIIWAASQRGQDRHHQFECHNQTLAIILHCSVALIQMQIAARDFRLEDKDSLQSAQLFRPRYSGCGYRPGRPTDRAFAPPGFALEPGLPHHCRISGRAKWRRILPRRLHRQETSHLMFEFLKANDVVIGLSQPLHQDGQPAMNTIYVKGCDASHIFRGSDTRGVGVRSSCCSPAHQ